LHGTIRISAAVVVVYIVSGERHTGGNDDAITLGRSLCQTARDDDDVTTTDVLKVNDAQFIVGGTQRSTLPVAAATAAGVAAGGGLYDVETEPIVLRRLQRLVDRQRRDVELVDDGRPTTTHVAVVN